MSVTSAARRRTVFAVVATIVAALLVAYAGQQWSRSYADPSPRVTRLAATDPAALARKTYLIDCAHNPVVRPSDFTLTCGDANIGLEHTDWSRWGGARATGAAVYVENTCVPYCAAGKLVHYRVRVVAKGLVRKDGAGHYRTIVVHFPSAQPSWVKHHRARFDVDFGSMG